MTDEYYIDRLEEALQNAVDFLVGRDDLKSSDIQKLLPILRVPLEPQTTEPVFIRLSDDKLMEIQLQHSINYIAEPVAYIYLGHENSGPLSSGDIDNLIKELQNIRKMMV